MLGKRLLRWMCDDDRTVGYVGHKCAVDVPRLIDLITGAAPTEEETAALSGLTDIPAEELAGKGQPAADTLHDPLRCYSVAEAAGILQVSADTVRHELKSGALHHVVLGHRVQRIPRYAIEDRLAGRSPASPHINGGSA